MRDRKHIFGRGYRYVLLLVGVMLLFGHAKALTFIEKVIERDEWPTYVNSKAIGSLPQVREVLAGFDEKKSFRIIVRYPGGKENSEWAGQLVNWFVAHGVPGAYVRKELGAGDPNQLLLVLVSGH